ncbi:MAG TPA: hypothetical protein VGN32_16795 [Ktedonobacterales bacterium]|nr:hypothetical protein [Ktedonobacterales bacterium]
MDPQLLWYLALSVALPPAIALVLWAARQQMWRTIGLLSLLALSLGLGSVLILTIEYRSLGIDPSYFFGNLGGANGPPPDATLALYQTYERWRQMILSGALSLATAAWIIGMYHTIQARRWRWLAAIVVSASLSGFTSQFAYNPWFISIFPPFVGLLATHPFAKVLTVAVLPYLLAAVTAFYSLGVLRPRAATLDAAQVAPNAPRALSLADALNAPPAGALADDVVFEVEELPRR